MVVVRMNEDEFKQPEKLQRQTTQKYTSGYLRKVALQKPVTGKHRNESADDFLLDMLGPKRSLMLSTIILIRQFICQYIYFVTAFLLFLLLGFCSMGNHQHHYRQTVEKNQSHWVCISV